MHPYGGVPYCPRCSKAVYAAEQIMGPGRMLYHKPCLACTTCNKRLDSLSLMEHDKEPYCKQCYNKSFGPRDLRQANLPHRDDLPPPLSTSPVRPTLTGSPARSFRSTSPTREEIETEARFERAKRGPPERIGSPSSSVQARVLAKRMENLAVSEEAEKALIRPEDDSSPVNGDFDRIEEEEEDDEDEGFERQRKPEEREFERSTPGIPRTIPLTPTHLARSQSAGASPRPHSPTSPISASHALPGSPTPLRQTMTGTRYGAALAGQNTGTGNGRGGSPRFAMPGTSTPLCARCSKPVYFAEQVKANGRVFHKPCLRCTDCNTALDSARLAEKGEKVVCRSCYSKLYGPKGSGYALLGKAGA
ncbi:LIM-domain-containing protein [Fomitiporia mediterranea MF3/22]|uniref:LIM-domain-containing protein n=1 Tax=Fomitiporia mediterranea (strain MF3/22) TaxID=694068 RepID=UPI0004409523|nr:LIM-domain-containing protein [Fomitiporia mediterranea MF3/22]EJD04894.1 LIM-domain-containing protein [Fomitiporia mediterranea MF3/22]